MSSAIYESVYHIESEKGFALSLKQSDIIATVIANCGNYAGKAVTPAIFSVCYGSNVLRVSDI